MPMTPEIPLFPSDGGEVGALIRARDWSESPLGPPAAWPGPVRTLVAVMLAAKQPMFLAWGDELTLLGALQLRWHTRLAGRIERELMARPMAFEDAVVDAWRATAAELPGIRAIVDHHRAHPLDDAMALAMDKAVPRLDAIAHHLSLMSQQGEEHEVLGGISEQVADLGDEIYAASDREKLREWGNQIDAPEKAH